MRVWAQLSVIAVLAALGGAAWYYAPWTADGAVDRAAAARGAPLPVIVAAARAGTVTETIEAVGTTRAREAVTVTAKTTGMVEEISFEDGQTVAAGTPLVRLDSTEIAAGVTSAEAELRNSKQLLERAEALVQGRSVTRAQVETLRSDVDVKAALLAAQQARLAERTVLAPFAGTLGIRQVSLGALVSPGDAIVTLDDLTRMRVDFDLPEVLLAQLRPGLELEVRSDTYPDRAFTATVTSIDTRIDPATRSVATVAEIDNRDGLLRPGMFLSVRVILSTDDAAILIPEQALVPQGTSQYVYVIEDGKAARREVEIGSRQSGTVEIRSGLALGESVVIEGTQRLRDGAAVTVQAAETGAAS